MASPVIVSKRLLLLPAPLRFAAIASNRPFSVLNRPPPNYDGHVPLNVLERGALAVGSAVMSLINPRRGGMYLSIVTHKAAI